MPEWEEFALTGDEFLAAYALSSGLVRATPYLIGHATELYLKAAYAAHLGAGKSLAELRREFRDNFNGGHNLKALWDALKQQDGFMPDFNIREDLYEVPYVDKGLKMGLSEEDLAHLGVNFEWYFIFRHHNELRYPVEQPLSYFFSWPGDFWVKFFKDLRIFIGYPRSGGADHLVQVLEHVPPNGRAYLSRIIS